MTCQNIWCKNKTDGYSMYCNDCNTDIDKYMNEYTKKEVKIKFEKEIDNEVITLGSLDYCREIISSFLNGKYISEYNNLVRYIDFLKHGLKMFCSSIKIEYEKSFDNSIKL